MPLGGPLETSFAILILGCSWSTVPAGYPLSRDWTKEIRSHAFASCIHGRNDDCHSNTRGRRLFPGNLDALPKRAILSPAAAFAHSAFARTRNAYSAIANDTLAGPSGSSRSAVERGLG